MTQPTDPTAVSIKATSSHPGGPPRWLVVVLVLVIGVGLAIQWQTKQTPVAVATVAEPYLDLRRRDMIPESHYPPNWGIFSHASIAVDDGTDRLWLLTSDRSAKPGVLLLSTSFDGGDSWYTPVDAALQLPPLAELEGHLHRTSDGALYITASGRAKPGGALTAAILRSTDNGSHWELWQRLPDSIASMTPVSSMRYAASEQALYVVGLQPSHSGGMDVAAYRVPFDGEPLTMHVLANFPKRSTILFNSVLPAQDGLFVAGLVKHRQSNYQTWIAQQKPGDQAATTFTMPIDATLRPLMPTLIQLAGGEIVMLNPVQALSDPSGMPFSFRLSRSSGLQLVPQYPEWTPAPTRIWKWEHASGQLTSLVDETLGPPIMHGTFSAVSKGLALRPDPVREQGIPGYRFHAVTAEPPGWIGEALVRGPAATDADLLDIAVLQNGEALLLVHERLRSNRDLLFLWRTSSLTPLLFPTGATASTTGSPAKTP